MGDQLNQQRSWLKPALGFWLNHFTSLNFSFLLYEMVIMCFLLNCYKDPMDPSSEPGILGLLDHYHHHQCCHSEAANSAS